MLTSSQPALAWRAVLVCCVAMLGAAVAVSLHKDLKVLPGGAALALAALCLLAGWAAAAWFLLLESRGRRVWLVLLLACLAFVLTLGTPGMGVAIGLSGIFLAFRRYRPWLLVADRRRALAFGLGLLALTALVPTRRLWDIPAADGAPALLRHLGAWTLASLAMFWLWSLLHLALGMRLHFLRLRPKLAVSAVLIGVIPLLLVVGLGLLILYTGLGGSTAVRGRQTLESWRALTAAGTDLGAALFDTTFVWPSPRAGGVRPTDIPAPPQLPDLAAALRATLLAATRDSTGAGPAVADTTDWFVLEGRLWLMRWSGLDTPAPAVQAWQLGRKPLKTLSGILRAGIDVSPISARTRDGDIVLGEATEEDRKIFPGLKVSYRDLEPDAPLWNQFLFYGGTLFPLLRLNESGDVGRSYLFINLRAGWPELRADFFEGESNLNIAVAVSLAVLALLFLVLEAFAVFFGVRISEGIVTAVHTLHRGTKALAAGDLDTRITLPNQDEFGELAAGFNEMTVALKHGRQIALANDRLVRELETARAIQERLLPRGAPVLVGFEVAGASIPSREIGGDYFDFLVQGEDQLGVAIGDVSGKGMPAALLMSNLQASLHGQVLHPGSVAGVVQRVNDLLVRSTDPHMFATFFYGLLDTATARFTCTNAGHNPPLLLRRDGRIQELTTGGLLLGMLGDQVYQQDTVTLEPGDVVVMYTDGITDAVGPSAADAPQDADGPDPGAMFGEDALREVLRRHRHLPAAGIKEAILAAVAAHTAGVPQIDDITLVVVRRQG